MIAIAVVIGIVGLPGHRGDTDISIILALLGICVLIVEFLTRSRSRRHRR